MAKLGFHGPLSHRISSFRTLNRIAIATYWKHALGKRMVPDWDANMETGIRFWRHQFTRAMNEGDLEKGRRVFDSLQTMTDDVYLVDIEMCQDANAKWYLPHSPQGEATLLYFHGGGYAFNGPISERYAEMLAHHTNARLFMPHYRLTPEHPHPAQAEDALLAWKFLTKKVPPERVVVVGDSAGGHMALTLLQTLRAENLAQPAICIALCPWTDIGARGDSLYENDWYDLVQGWMALRFGEWLDPAGSYGREALSPINYDYKGLAPLYIQAGGREILRDMIRDFAEAQANNGASVMLDLWNDMPHNFQAYDSMKRSSTQALERIKHAVAAHTGKDQAFAPMAGVTTMAAGKFASRFHPHG